MKQIEVFALAANLIKEGKTNEEIRKILFNTKGVRVSQINKAMELIAAR